jgi:hypothetical protein
MHDQFSIGVPNLSSSPFGQRVKNLSYRLARVEFESFWQDIGQVETARISNYGEHHFLGLKQCIMYYLLFMLLIF